MGLVICLDCAHSNIFIYNYIKINGKSNTELTEGNDFTSTFMQMSKLRCFGYFYVVEMFQL